MEMPLSLDSALLRVIQTVQENILLQIKLRSIKLVAVLVSIEPVLEMNHSNLMKVILKNFPEEPFLFSIYTTNSLLKSMLFYMLFDVGNSNFSPKNEPVTFKEGCNKEGAKSKSYFVSNKSNVPKEQMKFHESDYFKERSKERYNI